MSLGRRFNPPEFYGMNYFEMIYDDNTKLNAAEAKAIFSHWYNSGNAYNYNDEPENNDAGKFNVQHMIFITSWLVLLVNCHIKYGNKLTIYI